MSITLAELAQQLGGTYCGDGQMKIVGAAILRDATAGEVTFADRADLAREVAASKASAVIVPPGFEPQGIAYITVANAVAAFTQAVMHFRPQLKAQSVGISPAAFVCASAKIGEGVEIHPQATIGENVVIGARTVIHSGVHIMHGCRIAEDVTIFPGVVLYENTIVGARCILHAGAVLGSFGFGYESSTGKHKLSAQIGYVELESDVDIGANVAIDRGTFGPTKISTGTKVDNLVQIAHNVRVGKHNLLCSQVGIAGSSTTGDYVVLAGQVGLRDHIHVGDRAMVGAQAGVTNNVPVGEVYLGSPARPVRETKQGLMAMSRVPEMRKEFKALKRQMEELEALIRGQVQPPERDAA